MANVGGPRDVYQLGLSSAIFKRKPNDQSVNNVTVYYLSHIISSGLYWLYWPCGDIRSLDFLLISSQPFLGFSPLS